MPILKNISKVYTCRDEGLQKDVHVIQDGAVVWDKTGILWVGKEDEVPSTYKNLSSWDADNGILLPGLIDCHTHLAFGGWRSNEFEERITGTSYLDIAKAGGGILSTVAETRAASEETLVHRALVFLTEMGKLGITTVEAKSGYGLTLKDELKLLRVYAEIDSVQPITVVPTLLAAHTIAPEYKTKSESYIDYVIHEILEAVAEANLAEFCDVFVEQSAFNTSQARRLLLAAQKLGLRSKLHADQLSSCGGSALAAELEAISADHLECITDENIQALKKANTVAVVLPLASLYTHTTPLNAKRLISAGVKVAIATDFNPGSAPSLHLPLAMMLACNLNRLTPNEVLKGATIYAARAINRQDRLGSIEVGKCADFAIIDSNSVTQWIYNFRANACIATIKNGELIHNTSIKREKNGKL